MSDLDTLRRRIDELDEEIVRLLNARSACAVEIGELKRALGLAIYQPGREREVLEHVTGVNPGPLDHAAIRRLYERIIDEARRLERLAAAGQQGRARIGNDTSGTSETADRAGRAERDA